MLLHDLERQCDARELLSLTLLLSLHSFMSPPELGCHCVNLAQAVGVVLIGRKGQDKIKA